MKIYFNIHSLHTYNKIEWAKAIQLRLKRKNVKIILKKYIFLVVVDLYLIGFFGYGLRNANQFLISMENLDIRQNFILIFSFNIQISIHHFLWNFELKKREIVKRTKIAVRLKFCKKNSKVKLGYNDHGYNEFTAITN